MAGNTCDASPPADTAAVAVATTAPPAVTLGKVTLEVEGGRLLLRNGRTTRVCHRLRLLKATGMLRAFYGGEGMIQLPLPHDHRDVCLSRLADLAESCNVPHGFRPTGEILGTTTTSSTSSSSPSSICSAAQDKYAHLLGCFNLSNGGGVTKKSHSDMVRHLAVLRVHLPSDVSILTEGDDAKRQSLMQSRADISRKMQEVEDALLLSNKRDETRRVAVLAEAEKSREERKMQALRVHIAKQQGAEARHGQRLLQEAERNRKRLSAWESGTHAARLGRLCLEQQKADRVELLERKREQSVDALNAQLEGATGEFRRLREARTQLHSERLGCLEEFRESCREATARRVELKSAAAQQVLQSHQRSRRACSPEKDRYVQIRARHEHMQEKAQGKARLVALSRERREADLLGATQERCERTAQRLATARAAADDAYDAKHSLLSQSVDAKHGASLAMLQSQQLSRSPEMAASTSHLLIPQRQARAEMRKAQRESNKALVVRKREMTKLVRVLNEIGSDVQVVPPAPEEAPGHRGGAGAPLLWDAAPSPTPAPVPLREDCGS